MIGFEEREENKDSKISKIKKKKKERFKNTALDKWVFRPYVHIDSTILYYLA